MISAKMVDTLNNYLNYELFSSNLYLSMSAYLEAQGLRGFASWMKIQAKEEYFHAMKFFDYIFQQDGKVVIHAVEAPKSQWESVLQLLKDALEHERKITHRINELYQIAHDDKDHATSIFLQWFVQEQVEEESILRDIITKLEIAGDSRVALIMFDEKMSARVEAPVQ